MDILTANPKYLPPAPSVWSPPPERWFERYEPPEKLGFVELRKTFDALWLTYCDMCGREMAKSDFGTSAKLAVEFAHKRCNGHLLATWREALEASRPDGSETVFLKLLTALGKEAK